MEIIALKNWFQAEKRDLPWRRSPTPYYVWISEVMLQQTQVAVVIPYFERWMERFPTIDILASASLEEVIKLWEGLGYYSRARFIHAAAKTLVLHYQGELPSAREELEKIKGLGPYTIGAILSFAFHQKAAAVDGNVARVLARYYLIELPIAHSKTQIELRKRVERILPEQEPWIAMEALIELGAKICQKAPQCSRCPLRFSCLAAFTENAVRLPNRGKKMHYQTLQKNVALLIFQDQILIKKGDAGKVMADLYEFPYFEKEIIELGLKAELIQALDQIKYSYTRYRVALTPTLWEVEEKREIEGYLWVTLKKAKELPFSSGHRRLLSILDVKLRLNT